MKYHWVAVVSCQIEWSQQHLAGESAKLSWKKNNIIIINISIGIIIIPMNSYYELINQCPSQDMGGITCLGLSDSFGWSFGYVLKGLRHTHVLHWSDAVGPDI